MRWPTDRSGRSAVCCSGPKHSSGTWGLCTGCHLRPRQTSLLPPRPRRSPPILLQLPLTFDLRCNGGRPGLRYPHLFEFELLDLDGRQTLRSNSMASTFLLIFINPVCPHSQALLVDLAALQRHPAAVHLPNSGPGTHRPRCKPSACAAGRLAGDGPAPVRDGSRRPAPTARPPRWRTFVDAHGMTATPLCWRGARRSWNSAASLTQPERLDAN